jgi:glutaredoxin
MTIDVEQPQPPAQEDQPEAAFEPGPPAVPSGLLRRLLGLLGGVTGVAALLVTFGFLSERALYGFAGLPMLTVDYGAMLEAGANGLVKTLGIMLGNGWRMAFMLAVFGGATAAWMFQDRSAILKKILCSPLWFLGAQLGVLTLLMGATMGLVDIAQLANPGNREVLRAEVHREIVELRLRDEWDPVAEAGLEAQATYPATWLFHPLRWSQYGGSIGRDLALRPLDVEVGYPLRRAFRDRRDARELYGWVCFWVLVLLAGAYYVHGWRRRLGTWGAREQVGRAAGPVAESPGLVGRRILQTSRWLLEPACLLLALLCLAMVPVAQGVLADSTIGEERVSVFTKAGCPANTALGTQESGSSGDGVEGSRTRSSTESSADDAPPLRFCGSSVTGGGLAAHLGIDLLELLSDRVGRTQRDLWFSRCEADERKEAVARFKRAVDGLVNWTLEERCIEGLEVLDERKPGPGIFEQVPEAAEYWVASRERLLSRPGAPKLGYILRHPRGTAESDLYLFDAVVDRRGLDPGRWSITSVPTECIDHIVVEPNQRALEVQRAREDYDFTLETQGILADLSYDSHPIAFRALLEVAFHSESSLARRASGGDSGCTLANMVPEANAGSVFTALGRYGGIFRTSEPELSRLTTDHLARVVRGPTGGEGDQDSHRDGAVYNATYRGSAATALTHIGGPYAARKLAEILDAKGEKPQEVNSVATTSAGYLLRDLATWMEETQPEEDTRGWWAVETRKTLLGYLNDTLEDPSRSEGVRGATATGLGRTGIPCRETPVVQVLRESYKEGRSLLMGPVITAAGFLQCNDQTPCSSERCGPPGEDSKAETECMCGDAVTTLMEIVSDNEINEKQRKTAMHALYGLGLHSHSEFLLERLRDHGAPPDLVADSIGPFLEDASFTELEPLLLACVEELEDDAALCATALTLIHMATEGDDDFEWYDLPQEQRATTRERPSSERLHALLEDNTLSPDLEEAVCFALAEYEARNGHIARRLLDSTERCEDARQEIARTENRRKLHLSRLSRWLQHHRGGLGEVSGQVIVYTTPGCPACYRANWLLDRMGVPFAEVDLDNDPNGIAELQRKYPEFSGGVPVLDIAGTIVSGFDQPAIEHALRTAGLLAE